MKTLAAQMDAFRSQLTAIKTKQQPQPTLISTSSPTSATAKRSSPRKRKSTDGNDDSSAKRSKQSGSASAGTKSGVSNNAGMNYFITNSNLTSSPHTSNTSVRPGKSKFRLPAISKTFIEQIQKGEYVDFDKMKAKKANSKSRESNHSEYNLRINESTNESTLQLKKSKKETVNTFNEWMKVWNDFLHTRLHFHPDEAHLLLTYQKHITDFASLYKFEAVRDYDIDFRNTIANQRNDSDEERTVFWDQVSVELKNLDLSDHPKPPPHCYNCNEKGHMSSECQKPSKKQNKTATQQHYAPAVYAPYPMPSTPPSTQQHQPNRQKQSSTYNATNVPANLDIKDVSNYCRGLNGQNACQRGFRCRWYHLCNKCGEQGHGGIVCPNTNRTSTQFHGGAANQQ